jgi:predicted DNA binding CopG/RHH family protein
MNTKKTNINYGEVELDPLEFEPRNIKIRITTMIDEEVLKSLKKIAKSRGLKYQTLLNQILRAFVEQKRKRKPKRTSEQRIREIVQQEIRRRA